MYFYKETPDYMHKTIELVTWKNAFMARHGVGGVDRDKMASRDLAKFADLLSEMLVSERNASKGFHDDELTSYLKQVIATFVSMLKQALDSDRAQKQMLYQNLRTVLDTKNEPFSSFTADKFLDQKGLDLLMRDLS